MRLPDAIRDCCRPTTVVPDVVVTGIQSDSRQVQPGDLFVCMLGARSDLAPFVQQALDQGAVAILTADPALLSIEGPVFAIEPQGFMVQIADLARRILGDPSSQLNIVGITGTNGKTTCAYLLQQCLEALGQKCAYLGTLGIRVGGTLTELPNTTPFPVELWNLLDEVRRAGCTHLAMEVSSHALAQDRLHGVRFQLGAFTNFTQDHLDFHGTLADYEAAKARFFTEVGPARNPAFRAVINTDDAVGAKWAAQLGAQARPVSESKSSPLAITHVSAAAIRGSIEGQEFATNIGGRFNVENLQVVAGLLLELGFAPEQIATSFRGLHAVPGRFETLGAPGGPEVIVDYAHTPDALEKVLRSARMLEPKKLTVVFGCGGDRDRTKRPAMAAVASEWADRVVITSDNPRTENPEQIIREVVLGVEPGSDVQVQIDRRLAIRETVLSALVGEIVVIAGKGHEKTQTIQHEKFPMDDVELARSALAEWRNN